MKMKDNGFWVFSGVAAGAAAVGFAVMILPSWTEASTMRGKIASAAKTLRTEVDAMPGKPDLEKWTKYSEDLKKKYVTSADKLTQRDKALEQWFPDVTPNTPYSEFMLRHGVESKELEEQVVKAGIAVGIPSGDEKKPNDLGFNWLKEDSFLELSQDQKDEIKRNLQKRFWISQYVANVITVDAQVKPRRLLDLYFLHPAPLKEKSRLRPFQGTGGGSAGDYTRDGVVADRYRFYQAENANAPANQASGVGSFEEYALPGNGEATEKDKEGPPLGNTITFGVALEMDYVSVPKLVRNFLTGGEKAELPVNVLGLDIFVTKQNPLVLTPILLKDIDKSFLPPQFREDQRAEREAFEAEFKARGAKTEPQPVRVYVTCQVIDYEPASRPAVVKEATK